MSMYRTTRDVIRHIIEQKGRFACYLGAGVSAEAQPPIMTAAAICNDLRGRLLKSEGLDTSPDPAQIAALDKRLRWDDPATRYFVCVRDALPNQATRVHYFRELAERSRPAFCHHGIALLMRHGVLKKTCLTTNFDKLLESAFTLQGESESQPIRTDEEAKFWESEPGHKYLVVKLHGDYDTYNIVNTDEETIRISAPLVTIAGALAEKSGMLVLGTAGYEQSIRRLFDDIADDDGQGRRMLSAGLFWGVYMGERDPGPLSDEDLQKKMAARIENGVVSPSIVSMIKRTCARNSLFSFFPVWNSGGFLFDLIRGTQSRSLIGQAELLLDHPMRLANVFRAKGLSPAVIDQHIESLNRRRNALAIARNSAGMPETVFEATPKTTGPAIRVLYGDITSRSFMGDEKFRLMRRAVVSPEDTFLSAGGGVALELLKKAGEFKVLNELSKFAPIDQGKVAVTSGGDLPIHYLFHAAAIEVKEQSGRLVYSATPEAVRGTMKEILQKAAALEVDALWIPLMGTGVAQLDVSVSLSAIMEAIVELGPKGAGMTLMLFVFKEAEFPRDRLRACMDSVLGAEFSVQEPATAGSPSDPS